MKRSHFCLVVSSFYLLSFPRLISAVADCMSAILQHMVWISANVRCRSETCCTRLAEIQDAKNRHLGTIAQLCQAISFATEAYIDNRKKNIVKQQYLIHMFSQYEELWPTPGWDRLTSLGHPCKFQRVSRLDFVTVATCSTEANQTLHDVWPSPGLVHL